MTKKFVLLLLWLMYADSYDIADVFDRIQDPISFQLHSYKYAFIGYGLYYVGMKLKNITSDCMTRKTTIFTFKNGSETTQCERE